MSAVQPVDVVANLRAVRARVDAACAAADRDPGEVRVLPVSKFHPVDQIQALYAAGERTFGESRVQEAQAKAEQVADTDARWAVIGPLQTNKVKFVARFAHEFHALDSLKVAEELQKRFAAAGRTLEVFVQVNSSSEPQKSGLAVDRVLDFVRELPAYQNLHVRGLMTLAVNSPDPAQVEACFVRMERLRDQLRASDILPGSWEELSMGMSGDLELAIAHGATTVRVGTDIFGPRA